MDDTTKNSLVSVVIPTFNRSALLTRAVKSVQSQTYTAWELVIVDGGSDDTASVVKSFSDPKIRYVFQTDRGPSVARSRGVRESRGDFIAFTDDDDEFLPHYLEIAMREFTADPNLSFLSSAAWLRKESGDTYILPKLEPVWATAIGGGWIFRKSVFNGRQFDESLEGFEDVDLRIQCMDLVGKVLPVVERIAHDEGGRWRASTDTIRRQGISLVLFEKKHAALYASGDAAAWMRSMKRSWFFKRCLAALVGWRNATFVLKLKRGIVRYFKKHLD